MATDMNRYLIVNADDLGYSEGINTTIDRCSKEGVLRSATLMANGPAFEHAVAVAKSNDRLTVGAHMNLSEWRPVSEPRDVPSLVDEQGIMRSTPGALAIGLAAGRISKRDIRRELHAQFAKIMDYGLRPTHLDSHKHVHVLPQVLEVLLEIAGRYSIGWIRRPFEGGTGWRAVSLVDRGLRATFIRQHIEGQLTNVFLPIFNGMVKRSGVKTPDCFCGVSLTGTWSEPVLDYLLARVKPGVNEWMMHPGILDLQLRASHTRLLAQRERERDLLISPVWNDLLIKYRVILGGFGEEHQ